MDPGPEGKLYSEDYDEDYEDDLDSGNWMDSYDSTSNGKEALNSAAWPDSNTNDCLASLLKFRLPAISCESSSLLFNTSRFLLLFGFIFLPSTSLWFLV
jgi:hypothetical protein